MKVFLGGTCNGYKWREDLIPKLRCDYYNPVVENWTESDRLREVQERETADIVLYTITEDIEGVYSIAEVLDDSHRKPGRTIFCNLCKNNPLLKEHMKKSLVGVEKLLKRNDIQCFDNLDAVADYINSLND